MEDNTRKAYVGPSGPMQPLAGGSGAGSVLFVINLCASIAPIDPASRNIPGLENYRLYQVARVEDGRTRHRLRLGFFTSESHAQSVLALVRQQYPTAFASCLCDEDRKFVRGYLPQTPAAPARPAAVLSNAARSAQPRQPAPKVGVPDKRLPAAASSAAATKAPPGVAAKSAPAASAPRPAAARTLTPAQPQIIELTWEPEPAARASAAAANVASTSKQPALSAQAGLAELTWEPPAAPTRAQANGGRPSAPGTAKHPVVNAAAKTAPVARPIAKAAHAFAPAAHKPGPKKVDTSASMRVPALQLTTSEPPVAPAAKRANPAEPFHVGRGVEIEDIGISLQFEPPAQNVVAKPAAPRIATTPAPADKAPPPRAPAPSAAVKPAPAKIAAATRPTQAVQRTMQHAYTHSPSTPMKAAQTAPQASRSSLPDLDSTQTIRALTSAELSDEQQEKWFAVQLAASEQPVNLHTMPRLDIFEAYRLYSVATVGSGKIVHSLRLGFFKEAVSAEAVCGYLTAFFNSPSVLRVSAAEHVRFRDPPARQVEPKHEAQVVELSNARGARPVIPTVTAEVAPGKIDTSTSGAFKLNSSGSHAALVMPKAGLKPSGSATKRAAPRSRTGTSGQYKALKSKKSLAEQLLDEAREVELSESAVRKLPKNDSLLSRLVGKLTK